MSDAWVIAVGAVSALGRGAAAYDVSEVGAAPRSALQRDEELAQAGFTRPQRARAHAARAVASDRATDLLVDALEQAARELDACLGDWRAWRVGMCLGTSSGGMLAAERLFAARARGETLPPAEVRAATYYAPLDDALAELGLGALSRRCQVLAACASSTIAIGLGMRWLERGACDLVLAGGYDAVGVFVASGFEALRATSAGSPQPFRVGRDGMVLGEGAAVLALARADAGVTPRFVVSGFGASADAVHITAPDRTGAGLVRAASAALADAGCAASQVGLVSAHATATPYNDAAEAKALATLCPDGLPPVHAFKAQIGHTLGAAGVLELLAAAHAMTRGVVPASLGDAPLDPEASVPLLSRAEKREVDAVLKLSAAFGGVTAALLAQKRPSARPARAPRPVRVVAHARVSEVDRAELASAVGWPSDRLARIDALGLYALAAVAELATTCGREALADAGIVGGYALATLDTNERFCARLIAKGPRWVDPRLFPATSPNAGVGHCAIAFGLTGPNFAVGSGLAGALEALGAAAELVAAGDAERMVVVSADDGGPAARAWLEALGIQRPLASGAAALLLEAGEATGDVRAVDLDMPIDHDGGPVGHLALLRWLDGPADGTES
jgi:3-oxoacyl-[acyl-carrier-protein] synthase-1/3-oxoacyl-[acyl-carrier-protein] synthase II